MIISIALIAHVFHELLLQVKAGPGPAQYQCLSNHVIFVLCSSGSSEGLGLINFIKPLRASSIVTNQLKTIVFYADQSCIEAEWKLIQCYPKLFIYPVS